MNSGTGHTSPIAKFLLSGLLLSLAAAARLPAQGCMPLHFTTPSLGGEAITFLHPGQWQVALTARRVATNRFFVGDAENEAAAPFGQPLHLRLNSIDLSATYALSNRTTLTATVPYFYGTQEITNADLLRHQSSNSGIGDISASMDAWLISPLRHPQGNISLGVGVKAPTGGHLATFQFVTPGGAIPMTLTPTMQLGDGGWAVQAQTVMFQHLAGRMSVYASGNYSASTRVHTTETFQGAIVSIPDVYTVRAGLGFAIASDHGLSGSLGGRIDGTTVKDLFGGRDDFKRDAGYYLYVEPGMSWVTGRDQFTLSVPIRTRADYYATVLSTGKFRPGQGGVNDYIVYAGYSRRF